MEIYKQKPGDKKFIRVCIQLSRHMITMTPALNRPLDYYSILLNVDHMLATNSVYSAPI